MGNSGIWPGDWNSSAGGESAFLAFDPDNPRYVMGGSYLGTIEVLDTENRMSTQVMPAPIQYLGREARDMKYLYNWNAPIIWSQPRARHLLPLCTNGASHPRYGADLGGSFS